MKKTNFDHISYFFIKLLLISVAIAGCASNGADKNLSNTNTGITKPTKTKSNIYFYNFLDTEQATSVSIARVFYLIKDLNGDWTLTFDKQDVRKSEVERLYYWPNTKKFAFYFDGKQTSGLCKKNDLDRKKSNYSFCSTNFNILQDISGARVFTAVMSIGMSELDAFSKDSKNIEIDKNSVLAEINKFDLDKILWTTDYRASFAHVKNDSSLNSFIKQYSSEDPDGLVVKAKIQLKVLENNQAILQNVTTNIPDISSYRKKFTPKNIQNYCNSFKANQSEFNECKLIVSDSVQTMVYARALSSRNYDICIKVSSQVSGTPKSNLCTQRMKNYTCNANSMNEQKICDILNRKDQS